MTEPEDEAGPAGGKPEGDDVAADRQPPGPPAWLRDVLEAAAAIRALAAAQWQLFSAELALARSASQALLFAVLAAVILGVASGLTLLALLGWALSHWFGSWAWGLGVLALIELAGLVGAIALARRFTYWLTLPASRAEWRALAKQARNNSGKERRHAPDTTQE